jgi:hypothetical protein
MHPAAPIGNIMLMVGTVTKSEKFSFQSMIPKSGHRFSEKIMLKTK